MPVTANETGLTGSVTQCLLQAKLGESDAQLQLWDRYLCRLLGLARNRLRGLSDPMTEPDDLVSIVFHDFLLGISQNRFQKIDDRHDLWQVLVMLTNRRSIDRRRQASAYKRRIARPGDQSGWDEVRLDPISSLVGREPTPAEAVLLADEIRQRFESLSDERLVAIAKAKLQGRSNQEISELLGCSTRSVERKLSLIRRKWTAEELD